MKAILEFNLDEERESFDYAVKGSAMYAVLFEVDQELRAKIKYSELGEEACDALQNIRTFLRDSCLENGITL